jgi:hypothetical protein
VKIASEFGVQFRMTSAQRARPLKEGLC